MIHRPALSRLLTHEALDTDVPGTYDPDLQLRTDSSGNPIVSPPETFAERDDDRAFWSADAGRVETAAGRDDKGQPPIETRADRDDEKVVASETITKAARDDSGPATAFSEILTEAARDDDKGIRTSLAGLASDDLISGTTGY